MKICYIVNIRNLYAGPSARPPPPGRRVGSKVDPSGRVGSRFCDPTTPLLSGEKVGTLRRSEVVTLCTLELTSPYIVVHEDWDSLIVVNDKLRGIT